MKKYRIRLYDGGICSPDELIEQCTLDSRVVEAEDINAPEINKVVNEFGLRYVKEIPYTRVILMDPGERHHIDFGSYSKFIQVKEVR